MAAAKGTFLNHVSKESSDVKRLAQFYQEILGFEQIESPKIPDIEVIWLKLPPSFYLHLIERNPASRLPEGPWRASESAVADTNDLPRGDHMCFTVPNYDFVVQTLKEKGIEIIDLTTFPHRKTRQAFFLDPEGNGLEIASLPEE